MHGSGGGGSGGGGGAAWLGDADVTTALVEGSGVLDTVESPELHPASPAETAKAAVTIASRSRTPQHGTGVLRGLAVSTRDVAKPRSGRTRP